MTRKTCDRKMRRWIPSFNAYAGPAFGKRTETSLAGYPSRQSSLIPHSLRGQSMRKRKPPPSCQMPITKNVPSSSRSASWPFLPAQQGLQWVGDPSSELASRFRNHDLGFSECVRSFLILILAVAVPCRLILRLLLRLLLHDWRLRRFSRIEKGIQ